MSDEIKSELGDGVQNAAVGKNNRQRVDDRSNVVNNYIDRERAGERSPVDRLDQLERQGNRTQDDLSEMRDTVRRLMALVDGNPSWRIVGIPDQLAAYIKANEDWKRASEQRMIDGEKRASANERRIADLEQDKKILLSPGHAALLITLAITSIIIVYFIVSSLQGG